jgi:hypothetical protein
MPPGRVLAVWLDGIVEFETSDGEKRHVSAENLVWREFLRIIIATRWLLAMTTLSLSE